MTSPAERATPGEIESQEVWPKCPVNAHIIWDSVCGLDKKSTWQYLLPAGSTGATQHCRNRWSDIRPASEMTSREVRGRGGLLGMSQALTQQPVHR